MITVLEIIIIVVLLFLFNYYTRNIDRDIWYVLWALPLCLGVLHIISKFAERLRKKRKDKKKDK